MVCASLLHKADVYTIRKEALQTLYSLAELLKQGDVTIFDHCNNVRIANRYGCPAQCRVELLDNTRSERALFRCKKAEVGTP